MIVSYKVTAVCNWVDSEEGIVVQQMECIKEKLESDVRDTLCWEKLLPCLNRKS